MSAEERTLAPGVLEKELRSVIDESLKAAVVPNVPHPAFAPARRKSLGVPSHGAVLSEHFRGRCGETSRKAGCSSWARPV
jgi:hypothetical protein